MVGLWVVIFFFILYFQIFHTSQHMSFYNQIKINIISMPKEVGDSESKAKWNTSLPFWFFSPLCHHVLSLHYLSEPLPLLTLCIGLAKKFIWVFPYDGTKKFERTFWPTQYMACGPHLSSPQEHSVRDLVGPGPFTILAPLSAAFDEEPQVSTKLEAGR